MELGLRKDYDMGPSIGEGSFSIVRLGIRRSNGENVAVKIIDKKSIKFKDNVVQREISTMKLVDHPNCVKLYDVYDDSKHKYLVMELVTGGTVMDRVVEMTHFTEKDAATVTTHVLRALEHLHGLGITHRDIKPENLLYKSNDPMSPDFNTVKLADFGLAKFVGVDETMKTTCGTPGYVAPEIIDPKMPFGEGYGPSVDIWSLGIVLYIMLCGFPPFLHESTAVLFQLIRKGEFDFPSPYWDAVSTDAMDLVSKMLVVDAKSRPSAEQCLAHTWIQVSGPEAGRTLHSSHHAFMLIRKLQIFDNVDPACMQAVCSCLKVKKFPKGASVIRSGEIGDSMYFINNGVVKVLVEGREIDRLFTGDFFGEIALTVSENRIADVFAVGCADSKVDVRTVTEESATGDTVLFQLLRSDFEDIMNKFPVLKNRLSNIGLARVKRQARIVKMVASGTEQDSSDDSGFAGT